MNFGAILSNFCAKFYQAFFWHNLQALSFGLRTHLDPRTNMKEIIYVTSFKDYDLSKLSLAVQSALRQDGKDYRIAKAYGKGAIMTKELLQELVSKNDFRSILARFNEAIADDDFVIIEADSCASFNSSFAFDVNLEIAKHLNSKVLTQIDARAKEHGELELIVANELASIEHFGLQTLGVVALSDASQEVIARHKNEIVHLVSDAYELDLNKLRARLGAKSNIKTSIAFENELFALARAAKSTIVLP
ncbi:MAG: hypothetical protein CSA19_01480, partial [Deltaproteobacteria bacterium]